MGHKNKETDKKNLKLTDLSSIGEFGLIDLITKDFEIINDTTELSVGDDAAILDYRTCLLYTSPSPRDS